jgi:hypothetical protein
LTVGLIDSVFHLLIGFLTGTVGIHYGAMYAGVESSWRVAAITALVGAVVWMVASLFMGWIPLLGSILTFGIWIVAVTRMYSVGLGEAFEVAIFAWIAAFVLTHLESFMGFRNVDAIGIPGE